MLSDELRSIRSVLIEVAKRPIDPETARILRQCQRNLWAAADQAENMEANLYFEMEEK